MLSNDIRSALATPETINHFICNHCLECSADEALGKHENHKVVE